MGLVYVIAGNLRSWLKPCKVAPRNGDRVTTMQQLTELDNTFLQVESNRTPMHITPVIFYDQSSVKGGKVRFKEILETFERNLHKSKIFRRKLGGSSFGFDTPYWVEDANFDLEFHIRHISLPKPGDWRQLCILLSRLHSRGLDMRRPLWEAYVIEGLNEIEGLPANSFVVMLKIHHAAIDGVSSTEIIQALHSLNPDDPLPNVEDNWKGESEPSKMQVWSRAYMNNMKRPVKFMETVSELVPNLMKARKQNDQEESHLEKTRFNTRVSAHRVTDALAIELDQVKAIRKAVPGSTVNDVIVSIVGGTLRKYLQGKNELPTGSLVCGAPINVRANSDSDSSGNQVGMMTIDMATDVEDPLERLAAVMAHAQSSKDYSNTVGPDTMMGFSQGLFPMFLGASMRAAFFAASTTDFPMPVHTVVSNVPGPQIPLYLAGAKVHMMMGLGPLLDAMGLFHAVISGAGLITINFVSCREILPDPDFYRQCLQEAFDELRESAVTSKPKTKRKKRKSRATASPA